MFRMRGEGSFGSYVCTSSRVESGEGGHTRTLAGGSQEARGRATWGVWHVLGGEAELYIMETCLD